MRNFVFAKLAHAFFFGENINTRSMKNSSFDLTKLATAVFYIFYFALAAGPILTWRKVSM